MTLTDKHIENAHVCAGLNLRVPASIKSLKSAASRGPRSITGQIIQTG